MEYCYRIAQLQYSENVICFIHKNPTIYVDNIPSTSFYAVFLLQNSENESCLLAYFLY